MLVRVPIHLNADPSVTSAASGALITHILCPSKQSADETASPINTRIEIRPSSTATDIASAVDIVIHIVLPFSHEALIVLQKVLCDVKVSLNVGCNSNRCMFKSL